MSLKNTLPKGAIVAFVIILFVQLLTLTYWGNQKQSTHMDEIFTFNQSNGDDNTRTYYEKGFWNKWWMTEKLFDGISVSEDTRFQYNAVLKESKGNTAHPPLYFFVMHTIMSFFPGEFSLWYGTVVNLLFFVASSIMLFMLGKCIFNDRTMALLLCFVWGFSAAAVNSVTFSRMYTLMTFETLCLAYLIVQLVINGFTAQKMVGIFFVVIAGVMTQYYFIFVVCLFSVCYGLYLLLGEDSGRKFVGYAAIVILALCTCIVLYPKMFSDLTGGDRGAQAIGIIKSGGLGSKENIIKYLDILSRTLFNGRMKEFVLVLSAAAGLTGCITIIRNKKNLGAHLKPSGKSLIVTCGFLVSVLYIAFIAWIAPLQVDRYIFCVIPFFVIAIVAIFEWMGKALKIKKTIYSLFICVLALVCFVAALPQQLNYLFIEDVANMEICRQYDGKPIIYVTQKSEKHHMVNHYLELLNMPNSSVYYSTIENIGMLEESSDGKMRCSDGFMLFLPTTCEQESTIASIEEMVGGERVSLLYKYRAHNVYYID